MKKLEDYLPESVEGKNILITGGTTGIGRAAAVMLASLGANVLIFGRHQEELNDALKDLKKTGNKHFTGMIADVSDRKHVQNVFQTFDEEFGDIDVLINNAALSYGSVMEGSHEERAYLLSTNIDGYLMCANEAGKRMKKSGGGHIINIGSMSAESKGEGSSVYVATKSAIRGFSASLGKELNPDNIKVTLIEPGAVATDMQDGTPEEQQEKVEAEEMLDAQDIATIILLCLSQPNRCNIITLQVMPLAQKE